ncbi:MAG: exonuclease domain-containing protein [Bacillota bacterium]
MDGISLFMFEFNKKLSERERIFKLSEAIVVQNRLEIILLVKASDYDSMLNEEFRNKVDAFIGELVPKTFSVKITYRKTVSDNTYITRCVMEFFLKELPLVFPKISDRTVETEIEYDTIALTMKLPAYLLSFMQTNNIQEKLEEYLEKKVMEAATVTFLHETEDDEIAVLTKKKPTRKEIAQKSHTMDISLVDDGMLVGSITKIPRYITDVINSESASETVCGKVLGLRRIESKNTGKTFFVFKLNDTNGVIDVKFFPKFDSQVTKFADKVADGVELVAEGPIRMDAYNGKNCMTMFRAALCTINQNLVEEESDEECNFVYDDYIAVRPEHCENTEQAGLFDVEEKIEALSGVHVVFDLETTGFSPTTEVIIEIGACKIVDGVIVEQFGSLVKPNKPIPAGASAVNHIYDEDVVDAPELGDVIADFYKFSKDAVLVAHNASFDMGFLVIAGKKCKYEFNNKVVDTLDLARKKVRIKSYKLGNLCKMFDVELTNAHRAVFDAVATARVYKNLCAMQDLA